MKKKLDNMITRQIRCLETQLTDCVHSLEHIRDLIVLSNQVELPGIDFANGESAADVADAASKPDAVGRNGQHAEFGRRLRAFREGLGLSRTDLGTAIGVTEKTVKQVELGCQALGSAARKGLGRMGMDMVAPACAEDKHCAELPAGWRGDVSGQINDAPACESAADDAAPDDTALMRRAERLAADPPVQQGQRLTELLAQGALAIELAQTLGLSVAYSQGCRIIEPAMLTAGEWQAVIVAAAQQQEGN